MGVFMPYNNLSLSQFQICLALPRQRTGVPALSVFYHSAQGRMTLEKGIGEVFSEIFDAVKM